MFLFPLFWELAQKGYCCDLCQSVLPVFSSKSFIVSGLTFRSLIHFQFIFVYGVRKCSNFILLQVWTHCSHMCTCGHTRRHTQIHTHKLTNVHMQTHISHLYTFTHADTRMLALTRACAPLPLPSSSICLSFTSAPGAALSQAWRPHSCSPYLANAELFLKPLK